MGFATPYVLREGVNEVPRRVNAGKSPRTGSKEAGTRDQLMRYFEGTAKIRRAGGEGLSLRMNDLLAAASANSCVK